MFLTFYFTLIVFCNTQFLNGLIIDQKNLELFKNYSINHEIPNEQEPEQIINFGQKWPNGIIYYEIGPDFNSTGSQIILNAMKDISLQTCIIFVKRIHNEPDYIFFESKYGDGCHTHAGRKGGKQSLNLDSQRCIEHGKVMHELLHALGFHHEHQRPDRDKFIKIFWDNIKKVDQSQFNKLYAPDIYIRTFPYDIESILHYGRISFYLSVIRSKPILQSLDSAPNMGQRVKLSQLDVIKINSLYNCAPKPLVKPPINPPNRFSLPNVMVQPVTNFSPHPQPIKSPIKIYNNQPSKYPTSNPYIQPVRTTVYNQNHLNQPIIHHQYPSKIPYNRPILSNRPNSASNNGQSFQYNNLAQYPQYHSQHPTVNNNQNPHPMSNLIAPYKQQQLVANHQVYNGNLPRRS